MLKALSTFILQFFLVCISDGAGRGRSEEGPSTSTYNLQITLTPDLDWDDPGISEIEWIWPTAARPIYCVHYAGNAVYIQREYEDGVLGRMRFTCPHCRPRDDGRRIDDILAAATTRSRDSHRLILKLANFGLSKEMDGQTLYCQRRNSDYTVSHLTEVRMSVLMDVLKLIKTNFDLEETGVSSNGETEEGSTILLTCTIRAYFMTFVVWQRKMSNGQVVNVTCNDRPPVSPVPDRPNWYDWQCNVKMKDSSFFGEYWCTACSFMANGTSHCTSPMNDAPPKGKGFLSTIKIHVRYGAIQHLSTLEKTVISRQLHQALEKPEKISPPPEPENVKMAKESSAQPEDDTQKNDHSSAKVVVAGLNAVAFGVAVLLFVIPPE